MAAEIETIRSVEVPTRMVHGPGAIRELGEIVESLGVTRPMLITDKGIAAAGLLDEAKKHLKNAFVSMECEQTRTWS